MGTIIDERNDALLTFVERTSIPTAFPVTTRETHSTNWSALHAAQSLDISGGGAANFVHLTFWAQTSSTWAVERYVDVALFARQTASGGSNPSAMTPMVIFRVKFGATPTDLLSVPAGSKPVSDASSGLSGPQPWYMASAIDFSLPDSTGSNVWTGQNPFESTVIQQLASGVWLQIPTRGWNNIGIMIRNADGGTTVPGNFLAGLKKR